MPFSFQDWAEKKDTRTAPPHLFAQKRPCVARHGLSPGGLRFLPHLAPKIATAGRHGRDVGPRFLIRGRGWNHIRKNARAQSVSTCALVAHKMYAEVSLYTQNRRTQYGHLCILTFFNLSTPISNVHLLFLKSHRAYSSLRYPKSLAKSLPV